MSTALIAKGCIVCDGPVESLLSGDVMCNECIDLGLSARAAKEAKAVEKPCPMCDTDIPKARDLCDECIEILKDSSILKNRRKTDTLKLYELHIREPILIAPNMSSQPKTAVMYVLGKSEPSTVESIQEWLQEETDDWTHNTQVMSIKELTGPFEHGHIIYYGETDK